MTNLNRREKTNLARSRLTDFDRAVLAAAKMGALRSRQVSVARGGKIVIHGWFMGAIRVDASINRLKKAGELTTTLGSSTTLIFPDSIEYKIVEAVAHKRQQRIVTGRV